MFTVYPLYNVQDEAETGVLDKVELFDFMCHKHLVLSLSPNVNFILGRNGSEFAEHCMVVIHVPSLHTCRW